jgi:hypothetical protein
MLKYSVYSYYTKNDVSKESIDKVASYNYESALEYFIERKKIEKETFLHLYTIEEIWI